MSGPGGSLLSIRLRDGVELRVTPEGVWIGERFIALAAIQDARQVSPDPETVALRVAGAGLVDFQPEHAGDGGLALEAIYRLRPDLRPPGFEPRELPSGFPVLPPPPGQGAATGGYAAPLPQYGQLPPGYRAPPAPPAPYGYPPTPPPTPPAQPAPYGQQPLGARYGGVEQAAWSASRGELTPFPRTYGGLLGAIFQLYNRHLGKLVLVAIFVVLLPALANGVAQLVLLHALGIDPLAGTGSLTNTSCQDPNTCNPFAVFHPLQGSALVQDVALGGAALAVSWLLAAWQVAALAVAARQAVLGRHIGAGASLGTGMRRLVPTLIAWGLPQVLILVIFAPAVGSYAYLLVNLFPGGTLAVSDTASASPAVALSALLGCVALVGGLIGLLFFSTRLGLAPYAAATERIGPLRALGQSWRLTRGSFWRTLGIWLTFAVLTGVPSYIGGQFSSLSAPLTYLVLLPVIQLFTAPLMALTWVTLLYDLRLRRESYAAVTAAAGEGGTQQSTPGSTD
ncbi:MAG TPA: hypothetical protein VF116_08625 [Ktedonobacterales bacterium]